MGREPWGSVTIFGGGDISVKLHSKVWLVIILKMSEIDFLVSFICNILINYINLKKNLSIFILKMYS
jgi:hypothetical protein